MKGGSKVNDNRQGKEEKSKLEDKKLSNVKINETENMGQEKSDDEDDEANDEEKTKNITKLIRYIIYNIVLDIGCYMVSGYFKIKSSSAFVIGAIILQVLCIYTVAAKLKLPFIDTLLNVVVKASMK